MKQAQLTFTGSYVCPDCGGTVKKGQLVVKDNGLVECLNCKQDLQG